MPPPHAAGYRAALGFLVLSFLVSTGWGASVVVQAESGTPGLAFTSTVASGVTFVTVTGSATGNNPGSADRVLSYSVSFPGSGVYDLYARVRVGTGGATDDSFFYGNGLGAKSVTSDGDWILVNNLLGVGFTVATDVVTGTGTASATGVWKWIKLSEYNGGEFPVKFQAGSGAQTFQVGAREDGLDLDKFVFAPVGTTLTVADLDGGLAGTFPAAFTPTGPPPATGKPKFLGGIHSGSTPANFTRYFNQVSPENAGKWSSVEGTRDVMNWSALDSAYNLAKNNGYKFRLHTLVWGNQQPSWITALSPTEQLEEITEWFAAVAARYPNIDLIDVVNEPLPGHAPPGYAAALGGTGTTGWDWAITAFRLARQYFPNAKLCLNEYGVTGSTTQAQNYANLAQLLKNEGLLDGIGIQGHGFETTGSTATIKACVDIIAAVGVPIYITEMDVDGLSDASQLAEYKRVFPIFWEHPSVLGVTLWGYLPGMWRTAQGAYLAYSNGAERPAFIWLKAYVANNRPAIVAAQTLVVAKIAGAGTTIGTVQATDVDVGTTFQNWQITGGNTTGIFALNTTTGALTVSNSALLATTTLSAYTLTVSVADGYTASAGERVTIAVAQPFANWIATAGLTGAAAAITNDPDRDGVVNLLEYALGRSPTLAEGTPPFTVTQEGGSLVVRFTRPKTVTGVTYQWQSSTDLAQWTPVNVAAEVESSNALSDTMRLTLPANVPRFFLRLQVSQP